MRGSPAFRAEPSLDERLAQLDAQLRQFEAALRAHQHSHGQLRALEHELARIAERGGAIVRDLAAVRDDVRQAAAAATREALAGPLGQMQEFEARGARLLHAYADAVRAAQQAVARAEARIEAFDERVAHELAAAGREIREAASLVREAAHVQAPAAAPAGAHPRRLVPVLAAAALLVAAIAGSTWIARTLREASGRAAAAERQAEATRLDAGRQIAAIERSAQHVGSEALAAAVRAERMLAVVASPDARRIVLLGQRAAASASGQALLSPSRGVIVSAARLPRTEASETYQVWLVTPTGSLSLGFLTPDAVGRASGVFEIPADLPGSIRGFMLTREPAGGSARPSGPVVLAS